MQDFYAILDVPESASPAWVLRACETAEAELAANKARSAKERAARAKAIAAARATLTDADTRAHYDQSLEAWRERRQARSPAALMRKAALAICIVASVGAAAYWYQGQEEAKRQIEQERIAAEAAERKRATQLAAERKASEERLERDAIQRQQEEEQRLDQARVQRAQDVASQRFVADERYDKAQLQKKLEVEKQQREYADLRERFEQERIRHRAQVELDRQQQLLRQREAEANASRVRQGQ